MSIGDIYNIKNGYENRQSNMTSSVINKTRKSTNENIKEYSNQPEEPFIATEPRQESNNRNSYTFNNDNTSLSDCVYKPVMTQQDLLSCGLQGTSVPKTVPQPHNYNTADKMSLILNAQRELFLLGYYQSEPNGVFDDNTREALKRFQSSRGIPVTGLIDFNTKRILRIK